MYDSRHTWQRVTHMHRKLEAAARRNARTVYATTSNAPDVALQLLHNIEELPPLACLLLVLGLHALHPAVHFRLHRGGEPRTLAVQLLLEVPLLLLHLDVRLLHELEHPLTLLRGLLLTRLHLRELRALLLLERGLGLHARRQLGLRLR